MSSESKYNAISEQIYSADKRVRFFSSDELDSLRHLIRDGENRIEIINIITSNVSTIVAKAADALFEEQSQLIVPGGNAYTNRRMAACERDLEIILRYVSYAMIASNASVLDDRLLNGLAETYQALDISSASVVEGIQKLKDATLSIISNPNPNYNIQRDCSHLISELAGYFDYVIVQGINSRIVREPRNTSERANITQETERKKPVENQVNTFDYIDQKSISAWISEESEEEISQLTVGITYTLNLKVVESEGANMPGSLLAESLPKHGLETEWVVSSSNVELGTMTTDTLITSTAVKLKTIWAANFSLHIPIFGDSTSLQLQIIPKNANDASLSVLIYACGSLYRQFDIELNVISNNSGILSTACQLY